MGVGGYLFSFPHCNVSPQDLRPPLFPGKLDSTAGPSSGDRAAGPQHPGLVCRRCQCALLGLVSQTFTCLSLSPGFSEVNSIWKVVSASISLWNYLPIQCSPVSQSQLGTLGN